jgi:hypothetical protein
MATNENEITNELGKKLIAANFLKDHKLADGTVMYGIRWKCDYTFTVKELNEADDPKGLLMKTLDDFLTFLNEERISLAEV